MKSHSKGLPTSLRFDELRFEELPGISGIWIDSLKSALSELPAPLTIGALAERAGGVRKRQIQPEKLEEIILGRRDRRSVKTLQNIHGLRQRNSVAVTTNLYPGLFGGPTVQILKCLTAIKVCDQLSKHGITAVPVGWICAAAPAGFSASSILLLDNESELHPLQLSRSGATEFALAAQAFQSQITSLLGQIEEIGHGTFDPEMLGMLRESFRPGFTIARATGYMIAELMEEWGMLIIDSSAPEFQAVFPQIAYGVPSLEDAYRTYLSQSSVLPVISCVVDPDEVASFIGAQPFFDRVDFVRPMPWPQASATLMDIRSSRTLARYQLSLSRLFSGEQRIMSELQKALPRGSSEKLIRLKAEAEARIAGLKDLNPSGKNFGKTLASGREKILFQISKLAEHFDKARDRKFETARRQIHKTCNLLAPNGKLQERELAGIQMPLRYSRSVFRSLYEKLDILKFEHQIILMD